MTRRTLYSFVGAVVAIAVSSCFAALFLLWPTIVVSAFASGLGLAIIGTVGWQIGRGCYDGE